MGKLKFSTFLDHKRLLILSLDLFILEVSILCPKETWCYLDFIFDRKLSFCQHINFYVNKAIFIVKSMKMLGNLQEILFCLRNISYIGHVFYISLYMVFYCSSTTKPHYHTHFKFSELYKEELLYRFLGNFELFLSWTLKPFLALFQSIYIFKNSAENFNYALNHFY